MGNGVRLKNPCISAPRVPDDLTRSSAELAAPFLAVKRDPESHSLEKDKVYLRDCVDLSHIIARR
jgi:hypothetical protein